MSIHIDKSKCIGCGICTENCPGNLLIIDKNLVKIRDIRDCWGCTACIKACPKNAISYYLAADLGGSDSQLFAIDDKKTLTWILKRPNGDETKIIVDKTQSNQY